MKFEHGQKLRLKEDLIYVDVPKSSDYLMTQHELDQSSKVWFTKGTIFTYNAETNSLDVKGEKYFRLFRPGIFEVINTARDLIGKIVRVNNTEDPSRAEIYLITDGHGYLNGKVNIDFVLQWMENDSMELTFYEEMK